MESPNPQLPRSAGSGPPEDSTYAANAPHAAQSSAQGPDPAPGWVLVAKLIRPQGRKGEIVAEILTDFPERFRERPRLFLTPPARIGTAARQVVVENFWFLRSRLILKIQGIDSINGAEALRGYEVAIPAADRAPLEEGSFYISDLVGCRVFDLNRAGAEIGEVSDVDRGSSSTELLVVRRPGNRGPEPDVLIPFVRDYLVRIDTAERRIEMRLPEGLLDINSPISEEDEREQKHRS